MSERQKYRNLLGSVGVGEPTALTADNIAIVLCTYFEDLPECPKNDEDSETGWSKWAMQETDKVLDIALDEIIMPLVDRIEALEAEAQDGFNQLAISQRELADAEEAIERVPNCQRYTMHGGMYTTDNPSGKWMKAIDVLAALEQT